MLTLVFHQLQNGNTPLYCAHTTCVECLLSIPGIDLNIKDKVSECIECYSYDHTNNILEGSACVHA